MCGNIDTQPYRAKQLAEALYRGWIGDLGELTTWPKALRERLAAEGYRVGLPEIVQTFRSADGTERYLIAGDDDKTVETVWMPEGDDGEAGDGSEAGAEESCDRSGRTPSGYDLRFEPGWLRSELPVLPDGEVGNSAQPVGG